MNILQRNFFRLLRSGALNEYESLEPMSLYKWQQLAKLVERQGVAEIAVKGLRNHTFDENANFPKTLIDDLQAIVSESEKTNTLARLSNRFLNRRLRKIQKGERHELDASMPTLDLLNIIVRNIGLILNSGISLSAISELGSYLRTRGDKVDFVKLERWLSKLHIRRMAQLQGSMLMAVFMFEQDELPFVEHVESSAYKLVMRSVHHTVNDTAEEWHFRQGKAGFLQNNSSLLRRNLRRGLCYVVYAPIETVSNFFHNFARSLQEIEE